MPEQKRRYRIVLNGPAPADLPKRCAATWCELLDVVERFRAQRSDSEHSDQPDRADERSRPGQERKPVRAS